ncbi:pectinesterase inhibitor 3-like [Magnolia sinica]|uniref:pectinesterase inhibitor 3-like n=1 Tax=Magnolia sinica TaxID=86752 RepID=UPI002658CF57|nr:pectinesterase inhibitor 3-like [Magnolia sinica]
MASQRTPFSLYFLLISLLSLSSETRNVTARDTETPSDLVRASCTHARYPTLCIQSLSSYAPSPKNPNDLAQAAVSVTLSRARHVSAFVSRILSTRSPGKRERNALSDCVEQLSDSIDELRRTLSELRHLRAGTFRWQMSNAETWVSAALTNEDTCLDGFQSVAGSAKTAVRKKIRNVARVTSNALYLINRVAQTSGRGT